MGSCQPLLDDSLTNHVLAHIIEFFPVWSHAFAITVRDTGGGGGGGGGGGRKNEGGLRWVIIDCRVLAKLKTNYATPAGVYKDVIYDQHYTGIY